MSTAAGARRVEWVVFDLGGVIIRIHRTWRDAAEAAGVRSPVDPAKHREEEFRSLISLQQRGVLSHDAFCRGVSELSGGLVHADDVSRIHASVILGAEPGAEQLLAELKRRGLATACLSNTNATHWEQMQSIPAFDAIEHRHASHLFQLEKPDEAIFRAFERATQARAASILYFDDLEENVAAAKRAGWNAVAIDPHRDTVPQIRVALEKYGAHP
ncbi:MAG: HAD-IA family hydrolase [Planctomycetes bacterium]|nr:HAD-IA family hydrolase [Planctomycetota bacterium]